MRAMECPLEGHHLEAENDEELFKATRKHADEVHPEQGFTDQQLRSIIGDCRWSGGLGADRGGDLPLMPDRSAHRRSLGWAQES
jgi:predicted small metal-binding protein